MREEPQNVGTQLEEVTELMRLCATVPRSLWKFHWAT